MNSSLKPVGEFAALLPLALVLLSPQAKCPGCPNPLDDSTWKQLQEDEKRTKRMEDLDKQRKMQEDAERFHIKLESPRVKAIQQALIDAGYNPGPVDGNWGPQTRAAVISFQRSRGLLPDGKVGKATAQALHIN